MLLNGRALAWHVRGSVFNPHDGGERLRQVEVRACALSLLLSSSSPLSVLPQLWGPEGGAGVGRADRGCMLPRPWLPLGWSLWFFLGAPLPEAPP